MESENYQQKYLDIFEKYLDTLETAREHWETSEELKSSLEVALKDMNNIFHVLSGAGERLSVVAHKLNQHKHNPIIVENIATVLLHIGECFSVQQPWPKDTNLMSHQPSAENQIEQLAAHELKIYQN